MEFRTLPRPTPTVAGCAVPLAPTVTVASAAAIAWARPYVHRALAGGVTAVTRRAQLDGLAVGLRSAVDDNLPVIGRSTDGLFLAYGHYRNGILLAPATAFVLVFALTGVDLVDRCDVERDRHREFERLAQVAHVEARLEALPVRSETYPCSAVSTAPGAMALTRMRIGAHSRASALVSVSTPPLAAV